jgi:hypothetical protein
VMVHAARYAAGASLGPAAIGMRLGGVGAAWFLHLWFLLMVGIIGGLLAVSMCLLYPTDVRTTGMNFAHQVRAALCMQQPYTILSRTTACRFQRPACCVSAPAAPVVLADGGHHWRPAGGGNVPAVPPLKCAPQA